MNKGAGMVFARMFGQETVRCAAALGIYFLLPGVVLLAAYVSALILGKYFPRLWRLLPAAGYAFGGPNEEMGSAISELKTFAAVCRHKNFPAQGIQSVCWKHLKPLPGVAYPYFPAAKLFRASEEWRKNIPYAVVKKLYRAGEAVGLSQPGVSAHIHRLENYFGVCLVERSAKRLQITDAGMRVYRSAQEILKILDETAREIRGGTGQVSGKLHIGGTLTIGECVLPGLMGKFRETHPGVQLELTVENTMEIRRMVREEQVELGFVEASTRAMNLKRAISWKIRWCF